MMERTISRLFQDSELLVLFQKAALLEIIKDADLFLLKRFLYERRHEPGAGRLFGPLPQRKEADAMALLFLGLFVARSQGSLALTVSGADRLTADLTESLELEPSAAIAIIAKKSIQILKKGHECLGKPGDFRPLIVHHYKGKDYLYFQRYHLARSMIARQIVKLSEQPARQLPRPEEIQEIFNGFPYTDIQKLACLTGSTSSLTLISGGPGSGKTTVIRALLQILACSGFRPADIGIAAPTARAADRIRETLSEDDTSAQITCSTIHRMLGFGRQGYRYHARFPLRYRHIIIDETSMLDVILLSDLLSAVDPMRTALTFLGDPDQLPSVQAGTVLSDLMEIGGAGTTSLRKETASQIQSVFPEAKNLIGKRGPDAIILAGSHRSRQGIVRLAGWVHEEAKGERPESAEVHFLNGMSTEEAVQSFMAQHFAEPWLETVVRISRLTTTEALRAPEMSTLFHILNNNRILTLTHKGPSGLENINQLCRRWVQQKLKGRMRYVCGFPVMMLRNDYALELYNGDPGILLYLGGQEQIVFAQETGFRSLPAQDLILYSLSFAHTVHKAQGSEYDTVLFCLPDRKVRNLQRDLVYTAITRAQNQLFIHGPEGMLEEAARTRNYRQSGPPLHSFTETG